MRENGSIVKCFDEMCGDFLVSDELKKVTEVFRARAHAEIMFHCVSSEYLLGSDNGGE